MWHPLRFLTAARPSAGRLALAFGLGAALATGQAPLGWWVVALPALGALVALMAGALPRRAVPSCASDAAPPSPAGAAQAAWLGWFGGAGHFGAALAWIVEPFLVDPARHGWMAPFALLFLAFGLALFWAAAAAAAHALGRGPRSRALALALTLAAAELARSYVLTGFPWALLGHVWIGTPVAQAAALVGPLGLTLITTGIAAAPVALPRAGWALSAAGLGLLWVAGAQRLAAPEPARAPPVALRIVQPNVPQHEKWDPDLIPVHLHRALDLTAAPPAAGQPPPDLVIWPETAIPWLLDDATAGGEASLTAGIARAAGGRPVALGVQRREDGRIYNSLALLDGEGRVSALYDKHHLVPFGEYIPGGDAAAALGLRGFATREGDGYTPGPGPALVAVPGGLALPLICYEAVFPRNMRGTQRPDWLLAVTNDAWFGRRSGPYQHFAQARLRAIEQGLPLVRAANTGISAVIDARGRVIAALPLNAAGVLDAELPAALPPTPYARTGDGPMAALIAAGIIAGIALGRRRR